MDEEEAFEIYSKCMNMDLKKMLDLISDTKSEDKKIFYIELFNFVLQRRQKELVANEIYG